jgi:hypothetical protein
MHSAGVKEVLYKSLLLPTKSKSSSCSSRTVRTCGTPLCAATLKRNLAIMRILLDNGADPNARGNGNHHIWYGSPLSHAYQNDYQDAISMLLQSGAKFNGMGSLQEELLEGNITYDPKSSRYSLRPKYPKIFGQMTAVSCHQDPRRHHPSYKRNANLCPGSSMLPSATGPWSPPSLTPGTSPTNSPSMMLQSPMPFRPRFHCKYCLVSFSST